MKYRRGGGERGRGGEGERGRGGEGERGRGGEGRGGEGGEGGEIGEGERGTQERFVRGCSSPSSTYDQKVTCFIHFSLETP